MKDEIIKKISEFVKPIEPKAEVFEINEDTSVAKIAFQFDDFSTKPVLMYYLDSWSKSWDVRFSRICFTDYGSGGVVFPEVIRGIVNGTHVWAEDDAYFESGEIVIAGERQMVNVMAREIEGSSLEWLLPKKSDVLLPKKEGVGWLEAKTEYMIKREEFDVILEELGRKYSIEVARNEENMSILVNRDTFLVKGFRQCKIIGGDQIVVDEIGLKLRDKLGAELYK